MSDNIRVCVSDNCAPCWAPANKCEIPWKVAMSKINSWENIDSDTIIHFGPNDSVFIQYKDVMYMAYKISETHYCLSCSFCTSFKPP
jgi:hypothetical protein